MNHQIFEEIIEVVITTDPQDKDGLSNGYTYNGHIVQEAINIYQHIMVKKRYFYFTIDAMGQALKHYIEPTNT